jgi:dephospho-CoA kinase
VPDADHLTFLSAPLLFESGLDELCDEVWLVSAPEEIRVSRAASRDGLPEGDIRARAAKQLNEDEKKRKAHIVIENIGSRDDLIEKVEILLNEYR